MNVKTSPHQLYQFCEMLNVEMRPLFFCEMSNVEMRPLFFCEMSNVEMRPLFIHATPIQRHSKKKRFQVEG